MPNQKYAGRRNAPVTEQDFPPAAEAALLYEASNNSTLTRPHLFAPSPFSSVAAEEGFETAFAEFTPDLTPLMDCAVNRNYAPFQQSLLHMIELSKHHCS